MSYFSNTLYNKEVVLDTGETVGTGWLPPLADLRDYTVEKPVISKMTEALKILPAAVKGTSGEMAPKAPPASIPSSTDWRSFCSPIENQGNLGSCSAHATIGVVEFCQKRAYGKYIDMSRLFVYKNTRNLMGVVGDTGAWLRTCMGAIVLCGAPPEKYWPYTTVKQPGPGGNRTFDDVPSSFVYAVADNYETLRYFCHDPIGKNVPKPTVLNRVKLYLAARIPSMFGFYGFSSFNSSNVKGGIPFPCPGENAIWAHAIAAVGYDDNKKITNTKCNRTTTGALLIRNSWGTGWGDAGYGWLPYAYVLNGLAVDFWSILSQKWVDTGNFGL
jgi:C1A family cysteine protease